MPDLTYTPAALVYAGGSVTMTPIRFDYTALGLVYSGGSVTLGPTALLAVAGQTVRLDRLQRSVSITDERQLPTIQHQFHQQRVAEQIEAAFTLQGQAITELQRLLDISLAAQATAAAAAQATVELTTAVDLSASTTTPVDGLLLATSAGSITVSAHTRTYGTTTVNVSAGGVSGFAQGAFVRVYYMDAAREGGAVTYVGTTDEVIQTGSLHVVGGVDIPAGFVRQTNVAEV